MTVHVWKLLPSLEIRFTLAEPEKLPENSLPLTDQDCAYLGTTELSLAYEVDAQGKKKS